MASQITPEEIAALKANPVTAALGEKLEKEQLIPKARFDEINQKQKELADELDKIKKAREAEDLKTMQEQNKWKELAEKREKDLADAHAKIAAESVLAERERKRTEVKRAEVKQKLGERYLAIYDQADYDDLLKVEEQNEPKSNPDDSPPGARHLNGQKGVWEMTQKEFEQTKADVLSGRSTLKK